VPNSASARKRVRQSANRHALNQWRKRRIKDQIRSFMKAVQGHDVSAAESEFRKVCGVLDKIACTKTIHRNNAARRKSRLAARLNALKKAKA
jgi:small subunit ribosomal protein S20